MEKQMPLGKSTVYIETYTPDLLFPIARNLARSKTGIKESELPFDGFDLWNGFELSWLNPKGKPQLALIELRVPCKSVYIVESKSMKLYLNSFTQSSFDSLDQVQAIIKKDLQEAIGSPIELQLTSPDTFRGRSLSGFSGTRLDDLDVTIDTYRVNPDFLQARGPIVQETLYSDLLKSNCMATGQPDWGSVLIRYEGSRIDHEGLLKYIISYRGHVGFAEHCVEQIYCELLERCRPKKLTVYARYTKRGGLDINPFRSNFETSCENDRHVRQ